MHASSDLRALIDIMAALRTPVSGCPWDLEQNFSTIAPYTIEEAYEVADAIARGDLADLKDELGDLLLQVVFHARMAEEIGEFAFGDVVEAITSKLIRRHPHVFGSVDANTADAVKRNWEDIKANEKAERRASRGAGTTESVFDDVPLSLPALVRAVKMQKRAARVGFDWNDPRKVLEKIIEEIEELTEAIDGGIREEVSDEIGDLLFAVANIARHLHIDPETALRASNEKFRRRFRHIEARATATGQPLGSIQLDQMEAWWIEAKDLERAASVRTPVPDFPSGTAD